MKARPTTYKGVQMRSRLEAGFADWLDRMRIRWAYEPECFASTGGQYLPDFRLEGLTDCYRGRPATYWVEVKPHPVTFADVTKWADILLDNRPNDSFVAASPEGFTGRLIGLDQLVTFNFVMHPTPGFAPRTVQPWAGEWWKKDPAPQAEHHATGFKPPHSPVYPLTTNDPAPVRLDGHAVEHARWGRGIVLESFGEGPGTELVCRFDSHEPGVTKRLLLAWAPITDLGPAAAQ